MKIVSFTVQETIWMYKNLKKSSASQIKMKFKKQAFNYCSISHIYSFSTK